MEELTYTSYIGHLYFGGLGFGEGYALCLFAYFFFRKFLHHNILSSFFLPILMFAISVGLKAPCALIVLGGILFVLFQVLLLKKQCYFKWCLLTFLYITSFLLVMFLFVYNICPQFVGEGNGSLIPTIATAFRPPFFHDIYIRLLNIFSAFPFSIVPLFIVFFFYFLSIYYYFLCGGILLYWWRKRMIKIEWKSLDWSLLVMFLSGLLLFLFMDHMGFSQVYFYLISIPFGIIFMMTLFDKCNIPFLTKKEKWLVISVFFVASFCFADSVISQIDWNKFEFSPQIIRKQVGSGYSLNSEELKSLIWARDNIDKQAIFISNKICAAEGERSFVLSSYSEHQTYLEGYSYSASIKDPVINHRNRLLKRFFSNDVSAQDQLKLEGVTHVILFKNIPEAFPNIKGVNIYENSSVVIYQI